MLGTLAGVLKLFAQQHRNDMSAQAMVEFMTANDFPAMDEFTVEAVSELLEQLKASGDYDNIIAEANA
jgi:hypothetical protein